MKNNGPILLLLTLLVSTIGIIGSINNWVSLTSFSKEFIPIAPLTALLINLTSLLFLTYFYKNNHIQLKLIAEFLVRFNLVISAFVIADYFFINNWSFEDFLFKKSFVFGDGNIAKISPLAAVLLGTINGSFLLIKGLNKSYVKNIFRVFFHLNFLISLIFLIGFIEDISFVSNYDVLSLSAPTALCFIILSLVQLNFLGYNVWPFHYFSKKDISSKLIQLFLPVILVFLLIAQILDVHFFTKINNRFSPIILLVAVIAIFYILIVQLSKYIGKDLEMVNRNLVKSEERYKSVVDISPSAIIIHVNGKIIFQNPAVGRLIGGSESHKIIGRLINDFVYPDDIQIISNRIKKLYETGEQTPLIVERLLKEDGTLFYAEVTSFLMDYNEQKAVLSIVSDITERMKAELVSEFYQNISASLLTSDSLVDVLKIIRLELSKIMKTDNFYIAFYNEETGMLKADIEVDEMDKIDEWKAEGSITGYLMEQQVSKLFSKNDFLKLNKELNYGLVGTLPECWLGVPLIEDGKTVGALVVQSYNNPNEYTLFHQSILELIANQLSGFIKHKESERLLQDSEKSFRGLFHTIGDAIYIQDYEAKFIDVNEGLVKMYGYNRNELIGKTPDFLAAPDKNDLAAVFECFDKVKLGTPQVFEFWGLRKDGSIFPKTVRQFSGTYFGKDVIITLASDITNRKKLEFELVEAKEKAEESERLKSAFLANMSHEIRTPMNSILGFSDLLMSENISVEKREKYHEIVNSSGKRLLNLITDIIDISKIDAQQLSMSYSIFNINKLIDNLYHQFNISPKKKNIVLSRHKSLPEEQGFVNCDETRLAQVLSNLIENALKFTNEGHVDFGYDMKDDKIHFYVKDSGIGINKKDHHLIFDRFGQSDSDKLTVKAGSGLGLSISKGIVEILGGTIWVESEIGKGSTFHFTIPKCLVANNSINSETIDHNNELERNPKVTILIAEDELSNYYYLEAVLEEYQFNLIHVENGQEAVDVALSNEKIDLILMDFNMPIMNGVDATIEIRKKKSTLPIIALTAYAMKEDKDKALSAGCNDYLSKPITKDLLLETVHKYLKKDI